MPSHAHKACQKELKRLKKTPTAMPEYGLIRNYLELMVELPWSNQSTDTLDIVQARCGPLVHGALREAIVDTPKSTQCLS